MCPDRTTIYVGEEDGYIYIFFALGGGCMMMLEISSYFGETDDRIHAEYRSGEIGIESG